MHANTRYTIRVALIVALGGFLMGFDASVISGVVTFIEPEFRLSKIVLGWAVASLTLTATLVGSVVQVNDLLDKVRTFPAIDGHASQPAKKPAERTTEHGIFTDPVHANTQSAQNQES